MSIASKLPENDSTPRLKPPNLDSFTRAVTRRLGLGLRSHVVTELCCCCKNGLHSSRGVSRCTLIQIFAHVANGTTIQDNRRHSLHCNHRYISSSSLVFRPSVRQRKQLTGDRQRCSCTMSFSPQGKNTDTSGGHRSPGSRGYYMCGTGTCTCWLLSWTLEPFH